MEQLFRLAPAALGGAVIQNYFKVCYDGRTTRSDVFPFGESFESRETALAGARATAKAEGGRIVAWLPSGDYPIVGEVVERPSENVRAEAHAR